MDWHPVLLNTINKGLVLQNGILYKVTFQLQLYRLCVEDLSSYSIISGELLSAYPVVLLLWLLKKQLGVLPVMLLSLRSKQFLLLHYLI